MVRSSKAKLSELTSCTASHSKAMSGKSNAKQRKAKQTNAKQTKAKQCFGVKKYLIGVAPGSFSKNVA